MFSGREGPKCNEVGLRRVQAWGRQIVGETVKHDLIEVLHGLKDEMPEVGSHVVPQRTLAAEFLPHRLEERTAELLHLID